MSRSGRTSASGTAPPATPTCSPPTRASRPASSTLVEVDGEIVSSSHIRGLVLAGEVDQAARFLGAPFALRGEVVHGDKRGRTLGFPTANLVPDEHLVCPGHGVYAARADGACAAVSIGVRPTFGSGRAVIVEAFLLDRDEDLYGQHAADRLPQPAARRAAVRHASRRSWSRCTTTSSRPGCSVVRADALC